MLQSLLRNKKSTGLVLAGIAAFAYYRYTRMTDEEKSKLVDTITNAGKDFFGKFMRNSSQNGSDGKANNFASAGTDQNYSGAQL